MLNHPSPCLFFLLVYSKEAEIQETNTTVTVKNYFHRLPGKPYTIQTSCATLASQFSQLPLKRAGAEKRVNHSGEPKTRAHPPVRILGMRRSQNYYGSTRKIQYPFECEGLGMGVPRRAHVSTGSEAMGRTVEGLKAQMQKATGSGKVHSARNYRYGNNLDNNNIGSLPPGSV